MLFYLGDAIPRVLQGTQTPIGWEDELGAAITGVRAALEVSEFLKLAHELRGRSQAELGLGGEVGEADSVDAEVAEDVEVRRAQIRASMLGSWGKQLDSELAEEAPQELPHCHADRRGMYTAMRSVMLARPDLTPMLSDIAAPTLIVTGDELPVLTPADAGTAAAQLPHGTTAVIAGTRHLAPLEAATAVVELVVEFWRDGVGSGNTPTRLKVSERAAGQVRWQAYQV